MKYNRTLDLVEENLLQLLNAENSILSVWIEDTIKPCVDILNVRVGLHILLNETKQYELKSKETKKSKERKEMLGKLIVSADRIDKIASQNAMFKVLLKQQECTIEKLTEKTKELEKQIEINQKMWEEDND